MAVSEAFFAKPKKLEEKMMPPKERVLTLPEKVSSERIDGDLRKEFVAAQDREGSSFRSMNDPDMLPSIFEEDMDAFIAAQKALEQAMRKDSDISTESKRLVTEPDVETPAQAELRTRGTDARIGENKMPLTDENWRAAQRALGVSTGTAETPLDVTDSSFDLQKGLDVSETEQEHTQVYTQKEYKEARKLLDAQEALYTKLGIQIMTLKDSLDGEMSDDERLAVVKKMAEYSERADRIEVFLIKAREALGQK